MKEIIDSAWGSICSTLFTGWLIGNFLWMSIVHSLGNLLGVSWLEVDHALRVFSWSPTLKEIEESNMRKGKGDPKYWENIKW